LLSDIAIATGPFAARHVEDAVIMEVAHDVVEIVAIEGV
jgi:hypothetical protein